MRKADDLYVMCNSLIPRVLKVGRAADPQKRACQLMASQPFRVKVLVVFPELGFLERSIHKSLDCYRVKTGPGVEWFSCELPVITAHVLARMPTYLPQLFAEGGGHAVEGVKSEPIVRGQDESGSCGSSLCAAGVSSVDDVGAGTGLATDGPGSPRQIVPHGGQLPVFGEVGVGVLAVSQETAMEALDHLAFREQAAPNVLEGP